jgi:hypothetical protein
MGKHTIKDVMCASVDEKKQWMEAFRNCNIKNVTPSGLLRIFCSDCTEDFQAQKYKEHKCLRVDKHGFLLPLPKGDRDIY